MRLFAVFSLCLLITANTAYDFDPMWMENIKMSNVSCPPHPNTLKPLPLPLPDSISNAIEAAQNIFGDLVSPSKVPGVVVGIRYMDQTWTKGFGTTDVDTPTVTPDGDTIFRIASITKVFTVLMLYQLYEQGRVKSLDDPITHYCPIFSLRNPYTLDDVVTLRQLASQMSGLPHSFPCYNSTVGNNICPLKTPEILERLRNYYRSFPSWTKPSYSNLAYALLGQCIIQKAYPGMKYETYVEKHILQPLEMINTGFEFSDDVVSKMATGYIGGGEKAPLIDLGWYAPTGQMYSTVNDLLKLSDFFNSVYIATGSASKILEPHLVREMGSPMYLNNDGKSLFGTPWEMMFVDTYLVRTKSGSILGYSSQFSFAPDLGLGIIVLVNANVNLESDIEGSYKTIIPAFKEFLVAQAGKFPAPTNPDMYTGNYTSVQVSFNTVRIYMKDGTLFADLRLTDGTTTFYFSPILKYYDDYELQVYLDPSQMTCLLGDLVALDGAWMYFDKPDNSGNSPGFFFPWLGHQMNRSG
ncbi:putative beta-lactamase-like 1 [Dysidea avara]|uniref:putative beta-lactamase-like 1 n=1 Tax=Dysidea avara TaxID=196820 RepID=UPI00332F5588